VIALAGTLRRAGTHYREPIARLRSGVALPARECSDTGPAAGDTRNPLRWQRRDRAIDPPGDPLARSALARL